MDANLDMVELTLRLFVKGAFVGSSTVKLHPSIGKFLNKTSVINVKWKLAQSAAERKYLQNVTDLSPEWELCQHDRYYNVCQLTMTRTSSRFSKMLTFLKDHVAVVKLDGGAVLLIMADNSLTCKLHLEPFNSNTRLHGVLVTEKSRDDKGSPSSEETLSRDITHSGFMFKQWPPVSSLLKLKTVRRLFDKQFQTCSDLLEESYTSARTDDKYGAMRRVKVTTGNNKKTSCTDEGDFCLPEKKRHKSENVLGSDLPPQAQEINNNTIRKRHRTESSAGSMIGEGMFAASRSPVEKVKKISHELCTSTIVADDKGSSREKTCSELGRDTINIKNKPHKESPKENSSRVKGLENPIKGDSRPGTSGKKAHKSHMEKTLDKEEEIKKKKSIKETILSKLGATLMPGKEKDKSHRKHHKKHGLHSSSSKSSKSDKHLAVFSKQRDADQVFSSMFTGLTKELGRIPKKRKATSENSLLAEGLSDCNQNEERSNKASLSGIRETGVTHTHVSNSTNEDKTKLPGTPETGVTHSPVSEKTNKDKTKLPGIPETRVIHSPISEKTNKNKTKLPGIPETRVTHSPISERTNEDKTKFPGIPEATITHDHISESTNEVKSMLPGTPETRVKDCPIANRTKDDSAKTDETGPVLKRKHKRDKKLDSLTEKSKNCSATEKMKSKSELGKKMPKHIENIIKCAPKDSPTLVAERGENLDMLENVRDVFHTQSMVRDTLRGIDTNEKSLFESVLSGDVHTEIPGLGDLSDTKSRKKKMKRLITALEDDFRITMENISFGSRSILKMKLDSSELIKLDLFGEGVLEPMSADCMLLYQCCLSINNETKCAKTVFRYAGNDTNKKLYTVKLDNCLSLASQLQKSVQLEPDQPSSHCKMDDVDDVTEKIIKIVEKKVSAPTAREGKLYYDKPIETSNPLYSLIPPCDDFSYSSEDEEISNITRSICTGSVTLDGYHPSSDKVCDSMEYGPPLPPVPKEKEKVECAANKPTDNCKDLDYGKQTDLSTKLERILPDPSFAINGANNEIAKTITKESEYISKKEIKLCDRSKVVGIHKSSSENSFKPISTVKSSTDVEPAAQKSTQHDNEDDDQLYKPSPTDGLVTGTALSRSCTPTSQVASGTTESRPNSSEKRKESTRQLPGLLIQRALLDVRKDYNERSNNDRSRPNSAQGTREKSPSKRRSSKDSSRSDSKDRSRRSGSGDTISSRSRDRSRKRSSSKRSPSCDRSESRESRSRTSDKNSRDSPAESIGKRLEKIAAMTVDSDKIAGRSDKRKERQYHPYKKESRPRRPHVPHWSFDLAYSDMNELLQNMTENSFRKLGLRPAEVGSRTNSLGRRSYGNRGRFSEYRFRRSEVYRTPPRDTYSSSEDEEDMVHPDEIPELTERAKQADILEEKFMGDGDSEDEFSSELLIYEKEQADYRVVLCSKKDDFDHSLVIPGGPRTSTYSSLELTESNDTTEELAFGSKECLEKPSQSGKQLSTLHDTYSNRIIKEHFSSLKSEAQHTPSKRIVQFTADSAGDNSIVKRKIIEKSPTKEIKERTVTMVRSGLDTSASKKDVTKLSSTESGEGNSITIRIVKDSSGVSPLEEVKSPVNRTVRDSSVAKVRSANTSVAQNSECKKEVRNALEKDDKINTLPDDCNKELHSEIASGQVMSLERIVVSAVTETDEKTAIHSLDEDILENKKAKCTKDVKILSSDSSECFDWTDEDGALDNNENPVFGESSDESSDPGNMKTYIVVDMVEESDSDISVNAKYMPGKCLTAETFHSKDNANKDQNGSLLTPKKSQSMLSGIDDTELTIIDECETTPEKTCKDSSQDTTPLQCKDAESRREMSPMRTMETKYDIKPCTVSLKRMIDTPVKDNMIAEECLEPANSPKVPCKSVGHMNDQLSQDQNTTSKALKCVSAEDQTVQNTDNCCKTPSLLKHVENIEKTVSENKQILPPTAIQQEYAHVPGSTHIQENEEAIQKFVDEQCIAIVLNYENRVSSETSTSVEKVASKERIHIEYEKEKDNCDKLKKLKETHEDFITEEDNKTDVSDKTECDRENDMSTFETNIEHCLTIKLDTYCNSEANSYKQHGVKCQHKPVIESNSLVEENVALNRVCPERSTKESLVQELWEHLNEDVKSIGPKLSKDQPTTIEKKSYELDVDTGMVRSPHNFCEIGENISEVEIDPAYFGTDRQIYSDEIFITGKNEDEMNKSRIEMNATDSTKREIFAQQYEAFVGSCEHKSFETPISLTDSDKIPKLVCYDKKYLQILSEDDENLLESKQSNAESSNERSFTDELASFYKAIEEESQVNHSSKNVNQNSENDTEDKEKKQSSKNDNEDREKMHDVSELDDLVRVENVLTSGAVISSSLNNNDKLETPENSNPSWDQPENEHIVVRSDTNNSCCDIPVKMVEKQEISVPEVNDENSTASTLMYPLSEVENNFTSNSSTYLSQIEDNAVLNIQKMNDESEQDLENNIYKNAEYKNNETETRDAETIEESLHVDDPDTDHSAKHQEQIEFKTETWSSSASSDSSDIIDVVTDHMPTDMQQLQTEKKCVPVEKLDVESKEHLISHSKRHETEEELTPPDEDSHKYYGSFGGTSVPSFEKQDVESKEHLVSHSKRHEIEEELTPPSEDSHKYYGSFGSTSVPSFEKQDVESKEHLVSHSKRHETQEELTPPGEDSHKYYGSFGSTSVPSFEKQDVESKEHLVSHCKRHETEEELTPPGEDSHEYYGSFGHYINPVHTRYMPPSPMYGHWFQPSMPMWQPPSFWHPEHHGPRLPYVYGNERCFFPYFQRPQSPRSYSYPQVPLYSSPIRSPSRPRLYSPTLMNYLRNGGSNTSTTTTSSSPSSGGASDARSFLPHDGNSPMTGSLSALEMAPWMISQDIMAPYFQNNNNNTYFVTELIVTKKSEETEEWTPNDTLVQDVPLPGETIENIAADVTVCLYEAIENLVTGDNDISCQNGSCLLEKPISIDNDKAVCQIDLHLNEIELNVLKDGECLDQNQTVALTDFNKTSCPVSKAGSEFSCPNIQLDSKSDEDSVSLKLENGFVVPKQVKSSNTNCNNVVMSDNHSVPIVKNNKEEIIRLRKLHSIGSCLEMLKQSRVDRMDVESNESLENVHKPSFTYTNRDRENTSKLKMHFDGETSESTSSTSNNAECVSYESTQCLSENVLAVKESIKTDKLHVNFVNSTCIKSEGTLDVSKSSTEAIRNRTAADVTELTVDLKSLHSVLQQDTSEHVHSLITAEACTNFVENKAFDHECNHVNISRDASVLNATDNRPDSVSLVTKMSKETEEWTPNDTPVQDVPLPGETIENIAADVTVCLYEAIENLVTGDDTSCQNGICLLEKPISIDNDKAVCQIDLHLNEILELDVLKDGECLDQNQTVALTDFNKTSRPVSKAESEFSCPNIHLDCKSDEDSVSLKLENGFVVPKQVKSSKTNSNNVITSDNHSVPIVKNNIEEIIRWTKLHSIGRCLEMLKQSRVDRMDVESNESLENVHKHSVTNTNRDRENTSKLKMHFDGETSESTSTTSNNAECVSYESTQCLSENELAVSESIKTDKSHVNSLNSTGITSEGTLDVSKSSTEAIRNRTAADVTELTVDLKSLQSVLQQDTSEHVSSQMPAEACTNFVENKAFDHECNHVNISIDASVLNATDNRLDSVSLDSFLSSSRQIGEDSEADKVHIGSVNTDNRSLSNPPSKKDVLRYLVSVYCNDEDSMSSNDSACDHATEKDALDQGCNNGNDNCPDTVSLGSLLSPSGHVGGNSEADTAHIRSVNIDNRSLAQSSSEMDGLRYLVSAYCNDEDSLSSNESAELKNYTSLKSKTGCPRKSSKLHDVIIEQTFQCKWTEQERSNFEEKDMTNFLDDEMKHRKVGIVEGRWMADQMTDVEQTLDKHWTSQGKNQSHRLKEKEKVLSLNAMVKVNKQLSRSAGRSDLIKLSKKHARQDQYLIQNDRKQREIERSQNTSKKVKNRKRKIHKRTHTEEHLKLMPNKTEEGKRKSGMGESVIRLDQEQIERHEDFVQKSNVNKTFEALYEIDKMAYTSRWLDRNLAKKSTQDKEKFCKSHEDTEEFADKNYVSDPVLPEELIESLSAGLLNLKRKHHDRNYRKPDLNTSLLSSKCTKTVTSHDGKLTTGDTEEVPHYGQIDNCTSGKQLTDTISCSSESRSYRESRTATPTRRTRYYTYSGDSRERTPSYDSSRSSSSSARYRRFFDRGRFTSPRHSQRYISERARSASVSKYSDGTKCRSSSTCSERHRPAVTPVLSGYSASISVYSSRTSSTSSRRSTTKSSLGSLCTVQIRPGSDTLVFSGCSSDMSVYSSRTSSISFRRSRTNSSSCSSYTLKSSRKHIRSRSCCSSTSNQSSSGYSKESGECCSSSQQSSIKRFTSKTSEHVKENDEGRNIRSKGCSKETVSKDPNHPFNKSCVKTTGNQLAGKVWLKQGRALQDIVKQKQNEIDKVKQKKVAPSVHDLTSGKRLVNYDEHYDDERLLSRLNCAYLGINRQDVNENNSKLLTGIKTGILKANVELQKTFKRVIVTQVMLRSFTSAGFAKFLVTLDHFSSGHTEFRLALLSSQISELRQSDKRAIEEKHKRHKNLDIVSSTTSLDSYILAELRNPHAKEIYVLSENISDEENVRSVIRYCSLEKFLRVHLTKK